MPRSADGTLQVTYYNEGIGTSYLISRRLSAWIAGGFGLGLFDKVADAYRFLVLNYELGDEIYIFGFSRGAYTARSLAGLIRNCGILSRNHIDKVPKAHRFYKTRTQEMRPDSDAAKLFRSTHSYRTLLNEEEREWRKINCPDPDLDRLPIFEITYVGVWDTVGALGIPKHIIFEKIARTADKYQFHDPSLSNRVSSARHAVSIDETRKSFEPALWDNLVSLNAARGSGDEYQQLWFPGDHGSVGGGGDITGLSNDALLWVLEGAARKGLEMDRALIESWRKGIEATAPLHNDSKGPGLFSRVYTRGARKGPASLNDLSESAKLRLQNESKSAGFQKYRPESLKHLWPSS